MVLLTIDIINNLKNQGYLYLLGKTISAPVNFDSTILTRIILTPTKQDLNFEIIPSDYDCYFNLKNDEALDLLEGEDAVEFFIDQEL